MSDRSARARRFTIFAAVVGVASVASLAATSMTIGATSAPTSTAVAPTTAAATTPTTGAPTTAAPTSTTFPGPPARASARVASPVDIEKIRATSLPLRTMAIATGVTILLLAIAGFIYGRIKSRLPAVKVPKSRKLATAGATGVAPPSAGPTTERTPLPPPPAIPLPPPVEDAVADTVIFEPPPSHRSPEVIAEHTGVVEVSDDPTPHDPTPHVPKPGALSEDPTSGAPAAPVIPTPGPLERPAEPETAAASDTAGSSAQPAAEDQRD